MEDSNEVFNKIIAHKTVFSAGLTSQKIERKFSVTKYGNYIAHEYMNLLKATLF